MDFVEEVGESSSPPRNGPDVIRISEVYNRLIENGNEEAVNHPHFRDQLEAHFRSLPPSYVVDINLDRVEDVLLHQRLLARAKDPKNRPAFHIRLMENMSSGFDDVDEQEVSSAPPVSNPHDVINNDNGQLPSQRNCSGDPEACFKLEDLNLGVRENSGDMSRVNPEAGVAVRQEASDLLSHEIIFSTADKPKLLSQLSALLSDVGLNIREAHVFSTTDGYSLDVFVVDGWKHEDPEGLYDALREAITGSEGTWSGHSNTQTVWDQTIAAQTSCEGWEIDWRLLKVGRKIAGGSCGDLYRGEYRGQDVAIKILKSEHLTKSVQVEFSQEVAILRQVQHENVVSFVGACTKLPHLCIVTEYMLGGSLYDYLHKNKHVLKLQQYLKFAIDVCKGMEYLHQKNIIHRDLKTANLLLDNLMVVKVADFGIARFQTSGEVMTAETGTYRWMAPEVISHEPYDQKADIFSFAIVLWELVTAKIPYATMTPVQAAVGVRQGCRPELPRNTHPKLLDLMQRCWDQVPSNRPSFSEIKVELETLLREVQDNEIASTS